MYAISFARVLNKSFPSMVKSVISSLKCLQRNYSAKQPTSYSLRYQVKDDVVVYTLEKPIFFLAANFFSVSQCVSWTYLSILFYRVVNSPESSFDESKIWPKIFEKAREHSKAFTGFCIFFGWACLIGTFFYSLRSIRRIILHKEARFVTLLTYGLPGYNQYKLPLNNISSLEHRIKAKKYIPVKLKGRYFYYLIDVRGEFSSPDLFDFTVGVRRGF